MNEESSIILFERGAMLLSQANTIQKAKELRDLSLTAADWAAHKSLGDAAIESARNYALEAERRIGELLMESERAAGDLKKGPAVPTRNTGEVQPTLEELGISRKLSSRSQKLAKIPREDFDAVKNGKKKLSDAIKDVSPPKPKPVPVPKPEPEQEEPNWQEALKEADKEIKNRDSLIESLSKTDAAKELAVQQGKFNSLSGRNHQLCTTNSELEKTAKYRGQLLEKIKKELGVQKDSQIIDAIKSLKG